jgi:hypothetical protein
LMLDDERSSDLVTRTSGGSSPPRIINRPIAQSPIEWCNATIANHRISRPIINHQSSMDTLFNCAWN